VTISGRVYDVWRGRTKDGHDALGVELDIPDKLRCLWAPLNPDGSEPVARGDQVTAGPRHYTVNGSEQRRKIGWLFDRTDPALYTG
jgi:hypothetical protein